MGFQHSNCNSDYDRLLSVFVCFSFNFIDRLGRVTDGGSRAQMFGRVWGHSNRKRVLAMSRQDQEPAGFVECKRLGGEQCSGLEFLCCCHTAQTRSLAAMLRSSHFLYSKTEGFGADALSPAILCRWAAQPSAWLAAPISTVAKDLREAPISSVS